MALTPIAPPPGVCLSDSDYQAGKKGRWVEATNVEFIAGSPQKIAGWGQATPSVTTGIPRAVCTWRDNSGNPRTGIGTETHLYYLLAGVLTDITPLRTIVTSTLTDPVSTTNGSRIVAIADSGQNLVNGDWVFLSAASSVGGITLDGWYQVSSRTGSGYNITFPTAAGSSAGPGGGSTSYQYPRVTLTNPFATTSGSPLVTVAHTASGASAGGYVTFSGASAVAGLTLNGEYAITSITDANHYVITASSNANATVASGGGSVSVIYDIIVQQNSSAGASGYGGGPYGVGAYGSGIVNNALLLNHWTLAAYGNQLLACPAGGTIYIYDPIQGGRAYAMMNAPVATNAMFVTPERFVVALGLGANPMAIAWCDQNDYTVWTATPTNTANEGRTLVGGSYFVGGIAIRNGVSLIFTDRCVFEMNYTGGQEVYSTSQVGDNCGLSDPTAVCAEGGIAYWMSDKDFWSWNGGVSPLPTDDVRAYVFGSGGLNPQQLNKCTASLNRAKRQVRFWYPSGSSVENNVGVIYQYDQQCWSVMGFGKTAGEDAELLPVPVSTDTAGRVFYDEIGVDANGHALEYILSLGDMEVGNGDRNADIFGFIPDFQKFSLNSFLYLYTSYFPGNTPTQSNPFLLPSDIGRIDMRENGKLFSFTLRINFLGSDFRLGLPRLDVQPSGARRSP